jgi:hypothetical protein
MPRTPAVVIGALASSHARFSATPLCTSTRLDCARRRSSSPRSVRTRCPDMLVCPHALLPRVRRGWELLETLDAPDVATALGELHRNPTPLVNALARFPATLVHGDPKRANVGFRDGRMMLRLPRPAPAHDGHERSSPRANRHGPRQALQIQALRMQTTHRGATRRRP